MSFLLNPFRFAASGGGGSAFPVVEASATSAGQFLLTQSVTMPSGVASGDLLVILFGCNQAPTTPAGWTLKGSIARSYVYAKVSDGTEGASVSIGLSTNGFGVHHAYRISGHNGLAGVEIATAQELGGGPVDTPALSPSWGADKTLWLAWYRANTETIGGASPSSAPTGYTDILKASNSGGQTTRSHSGSARRSNETATEDPNAFGGQETQEKESILVGIQPAP